MSSYRFISPITLLSATVTSPTVYVSSPMNIPTIGVVGFLISVGAGLTATFQLMVSMDGSNYYDLGLPLPSVSGSAAVFPINPGAIGFPYVKIQVTPSGGAGTVTITGTAKT